MKAILLFISLFPIITYSQTIDLAKWKACEDSWHQTNPELYEVHHPIPGTTLMRMEWIDKTMDKSSDNVQPAFYLNNGKEASVLKFPMNGELLYGAEKKFFFQYNNQLYCISYVCRMIMPDQIKHFQKISKPDDCPKGVHLNPEKITTPAQEQKLLDAYRSRFVKNLDMDIRLTLKADAITIMNKASYERLKKWNPEHCSGLSGQLNHAIGDAKAAIQKYERLIISSQQSPSSQGKNQTGAQ